MTPSLQASATRHKPAVYRIMALILRCGNVHTSTWITLALGAGVLLWYFDHIQFVAQSSLASSILSRSLWLVLFYSIYRVIVRPGQIRPSTDYHNRNNPRYKAMRQKLFPPGFPNGWHVVCNSEDVAEGRVKSISALGQVTSHKESALVLPNLPFLYFYFAFCLCRNLSLFVGATARWVF